MTSKKKKSRPDKKRSQEQRRAKQIQSQDLRAIGSQFKDLLLRARQEYAKGRSYNAVEIQTEALELGSVMPRFNDNSFVKAHALLELALAKSAIQTDFATGDEQLKLREEGRDLIKKIMTLYESRVAAGTMAKWRKEEVWLREGDYDSPVPHTERLGPIDYLQTLNFVAIEEPTVASVRSIKTAINFLRNFEASGCAIELEVGSAVQGEVPSGQMDKLKRYLREHESVLNGLKSHEEATDVLCDGDFEEVRHMGTLDGEMKKTRKKTSQGYG